MTSGSSFASVPPTSSQNWAIPFTYTPVGDTTSRVEIFPFVLHHLLDLCRLNRSIMFCFRSLPMIRTSAVVYFMSTFASWPMARTIPQQLRMKTSRHLRTPRLWLISRTSSLILMNVRTFHQHSLVWLISSQWHDLHCMLNYLPHQADFKLIFPSFEFFDCIYRDNGRRWNDSWIEWDWALGFIASSSRFERKPCTFAF